jgi:hypothetical protein
VPEANLDIPAGHTAMIIVAVDRKRTLRARGIAIIPAGSSMAQ